MSSRQIKIIKKNHNNWGGSSGKEGCAEGPPLRMAGFLIRGVQILSSKK